MATAVFHKLSKRKNSTKQPSSSGTQIDVMLKSGTSFLSPSFLLSLSSKPDYNYVVFENWYYFIIDIISLHDDLWEVVCRIDSLATGKADILASTLYVCYSSSAGSSWLADTRLPILKSTSVHTSSASLASLFNNNGFYVLSFIGKTGCELVCVNKSTLNDLIAEIQNWRDDGINAIVNDDMGLNYDFSSVESALESIGKMSIQTGFIGNSYANAPSCIRSCIWVPFLLSAFSGGSKRIYLGDYDTTEAGFELNANPTTGSVTVSIPWTYSDWRRAICEDVYLYLPLVGMVQLSADSLTHSSSITIEYSATGTDGVVCYRVLSGGEVIGTYGGQCSANYPIGINQQASAGEIAQAFISGLEKTVSAGINSSLSPVSAAASVAGMGAEAAIGAYNVQNVASSTHPSCIGGIGGGAGVGLSLDIECYTVVHAPIINPSDMRDTMGLPTMKPLLLSTLSGYCQCANAHIESDLPGQIISDIDNYLNGGFFIE